MNKTTVANDRMNRPLDGVDPQIADLLRDEARRQATGLELIPSENLVSEAVLEAMGSNVAVYMSTLQKDDVVLGMNLSHGGHLTHGHPLNFSGRMYKFVAYGVKKEDERIDYDEIERLANEHKPKMIVAGASAYSRIIDFERIGKAAKSVGALFFVDMAHIAGLVAAGLHPSPVPHADIVSTTTHKTLRGPRGGLVLCKAAFAKELDKLTFPGTQGGPLVHTIAAKAVCLKEAMEPSFKEYQKQVVANTAALRSPHAACANRKWSRSAPGSRKFSPTSATPKSNSACANKLPNLPRNSRFTKPACAAAQPESNTPMFSPKEIPHRSA